MLYDVSQRIVYEYDGPTDAGRHLLRLMPADLPGEQRLIAGRLDIRPPPEERIDRVDFFGNPAVEVSFPTAHLAVEFRVQARVERIARAPTLDISPTIERLRLEIGGHRDLNPLSPHHFLGPSSRVETDPAMTAYARDAMGPARTTLEAVLTIGGALHRDMRFDADATHVDTPPKEAFERRHGVCQDFSHVMIACLRGIGIPAGYVSGYLRTIPPDGQSRLEGADSMHAWVRAWCGVETGWVEFDPTNALVVAADHVVIARGRDYSDVSPVKGVLRTAGSQKSQHSVDMVPVDAR